MPSVNFSFLQSFFFVQNLILSLAEIKNKSLISHLILNYIPLHTYTLQEDQTIRTFAIYQKFLTLEILWWAIRKFTFSIIQPISVKINGKYIEKFNKVWRSNLCWDIYGSNKEDPDIYGFSPMTYIITHMTRHFLTFLSMGQKSINIWIILIGSINVST